MELFLNFNVVSEQAKDLDCYFKFYFLVSWAYVSVKGHSCYSMEALPTSDINIIVISRAIPIY